MVSWMRFPRIGQLVYRIKFFGRKRRCGRVHNKERIPVRLYKPFPTDCILFAVLHHKCGGICLLIPRYRFIAFDRFIFIHPLKRMRHVAGAVYIGDLFRRKAACKRIRNFDDLPFSHAVNEEIRTGIRKDAAAHLIIPIIIVGKTPEARFNAANDDRHAAVRFPGAVGINDRRTVRALPRLAAGRISIARTAFFCRGIMVHHGINVARADQKRKAWPAKAAECLRAVPVRLGENADRIAVAFEHTADNRRAEARMVHIRIADDIYKIKLLNPARGKFRSRSGQKEGSVSGFCLLCHALTLPQTLLLFKGECAYTSIL